MTLAPTWSAPDPVGQRSHFLRAAGPPGLFDRPDRAIAAVRSLTYDVTGSPTAISTRLGDLLADAAGTRFWTESDMREFTELTNELLDRLGVRLSAPEHAPSRIGVKASNRPSGRYALFRFRNRRSGEEWCSRNLPAGLSLGDGPR